MTSKSKIVWIPPLAKSTTRKTATPELEKTTEAPVTISMDATTAGTGEITEASINISMDATGEQSPSKATILFDEAHNELLQWQKYLLLKQLEDYYHC